MKNKITISDLSENVIDKILISEELKAHNFSKKLNFFLQIEKIKKIFI
jgi:hypothetical protein